MRYLLFALLLTSCGIFRSPQSKLEHLVAKYPELRDTVTVTVHDTVVVPADTVFRSVVLRTTDTVTVESEKQSVRIVRVPTGSPCDTAEFRAEILATVKADTVVVTNTVEVPRLSPCPPEEKVASWWKVAAIVEFILLLALYLLRRYPTVRP